MKVLFLSQRVPYPPNRGDKITTWRLVDRLRRNHDVTTVAFAHDESDLAAARELNAMGIRCHPVRHRDKLKRLLSLPLLATRTPLTLGVYGSREVQALVDGFIGTVDLAYAYSSSMGAFLAKHHGTPRVMHFGELDSDKWRQYAERASFPMSWIYRREWRRLHEFETSMAHEVDENVLCTPLEERIFQERIPGASSVVLRNGVDLQYFRPSESERQSGHLVFTGVMNYYPNIDGCVYFVEHVFPRIRQEIHDVRFTIVGANPAPEVERLRRVPGVTVTGFVDDTRDYLRRAVVSVAPLRIARGIQNKVLEAMAMGLPVVGSTCATQGVGAESGRDLVVADDPASQAASIRALLRDPGAALALGRRARRFVEENYEWDTCLRVLDEIVARVTTHA